jgi:DHA2 family multidrug resistance protein
VDQQAFMLAANDVFYGSAIIFVMLVPLVWLSRPARTAGAVSDPADNAAVGAH